MLECSQNYWNARNPGSAQLVPKFIQGRERGKCAQMLLSAWRISVGLWQTRWMFSFKCTTSYLTYFPWMSGLNCLKDWNILSHKHFWFTDLFVSCPDPFSKKDSCFEHPHLYTKQAVQACFPCHQVLLQSPGWFVLLVGLFILLGEVLNCGLCWISKTCLSKQNFH